MSKKNNRYLVIGVIIFFAILLLIDRFYWAQISQWREDQATNIWLGYTTGLGHMPVGLMSSKGIPNPNGMLLLSFFLSILPNLLSISFFLGVVQIVLLILMGWKCFGGSWQYFLFATIPTLSSVILRSISIELWNQHIITLINIFFIFWALRYLEKPSLWYLPPILALILLAPALYLAGIVNAVVMTLLTLGMITYKRPNNHNFGAVLVLIILIAGISLSLTWLPYFQNVSLKQIADYNKATLGPVALFKTAWQALFGIPVYATFQWADKSAFGLAIEHANSSILSSPTQILLRLTGRLYLLQSMFAFTTLIYSMITALWKGTTKEGFKGRVNSSLAKAVILSVLFISFSYTVSAWLGGPAWINNERLDQAVQFLPIFLFLIFLLPLTISSGGRAENIITRISYGSLILFGTVNLFCGFLIIRDHLQYRGNAVTGADVPPINKMQVVNFIAADWRNHSKSNIIPVDYDLGGGDWDWVPEFGKQLIRWYPAPMTGGRSFDYELLRQYGLTNYQEAIQIRTFGEGRYLITYAFEDPPPVQGAHLNNYLFGRLRVSIAER